MTETMVERVARTISNRLDHNNWDTMSENERDMARSDARAAIEAMKGPTEAMRVAGEQTKWDGDVNYIFDAMISAALSEKKGRDDDARRRISSPSKARGNSCEGR